MFDLVYSQNMFEDMGAGDDKLNIAMLEAMCLEMEKGFAGGVVSFVVTRGDTVLDGEGQYGVFVELFDFFEVGRVEIAAEVDLCPFDLEVGFTGFIVYDKWALHRAYYYDYLRPAMTCQIQFSP